MKINIDCMRSILLVLESAGYNESVSFKQLCESLDAYNENDLAYACIKLHEANMVDGHFIHVDNANQPIVHALTDITFEGHEFLANIRNDTFFNKVKGVCKELGLSSLRDVTHIATNASALIIKSHFGIS